MQSFSAPQVEIEPEGDTARQRRWLLIAIIVLIVLLCACALSLVVLLAQPSVAPKPTPSATSQLFAATWTPTPTDSPTPTTTPSPTTPATTTPTETSTVAPPTETRTAAPPTRTNTPRPAPTLPPRFFSVSRQQAYPNCGTTGVFGVVRDRANNPAANVIIRVTQGSFTRQTQSRGIFGGGDRNYEITPLIAGGFRLVALDAGGRALSGTVSFTISAQDVNCLPRESGSQWMQVDLRQN